MKVVVGIPHENLKLCLTNINRYLTDTENVFYKVSVISVKYRFTQISKVMSFNRYLTDTNQYILETNIIGKIG